MNSLIEHGIIHKGEEGLSVDERFLKPYRYIHECPPSNEDVEWAVDEIISMLEEAVKIIMKKAARRGRMKMLKIFRKVWRRQYQ